MTIVRLGVIRDMPSKRAHDRWTKDARIKSIDDKLIRLVVVRILADLDVHTETLRVGRPGRVTKLCIETSKLGKLSEKKGLFLVLVLRELNEIRGTKATEASLSDTPDEDTFLLRYRV